MVRIGEFEIEEWRDGGRELICENDRPVAQGSIMGALDANGQYAIQMLQKLQNELVSSFCPNQKATDEFNEHVQTWAVGTVWGADCRSW